MSAPESKTERDLAFAGGLAALLEDGVEKDRAARVRLFLGAIVQARSGRRLANEREDVLAACGSEDGVRGADLQDVLLRPLAAVRRWCDEARRERADGWIEFETLRSVLESEAFAEVVSDARRALVRSGLVLDRDSIRILLEGGAPVAMGRPLSLSKAPL